MMMKTFINTNELEFEPTAHGVGSKKVLIHSSDTPTMLTQFAYGKLLPGEIIPAHAHNTMEEIFYFLKGAGIYTIDDTELVVSSSIVVRVPAGVSHTLVATGIMPLEFIYFGIATI